jgi:hypothetical protein
MEENCQERNILGQFLTHLSTVPISYQRAVPTDPVYPNMVSMASSRVLGLTRPLGLSTSVTNLPFWPCFWPSSFFFLAPSSHNVAHRFRVVYNQGFLGSGQYPWWPMGEDSVGKLTHGTVGEGHRSLKNKMEGGGKGWEHVEPHRTSWNPMEGESRRRMGVMMSHGIPRKEVEGGRTRSVGTLGPYGRCWNLLHS